MARLAVDTNSKPIQCLSPGVTEALAVAGAAVSSTTFGPETRVIRFCADIPCYIIMNATATASDCYVPANHVEYFHVWTGEYLSVYSADTGTAHLTDMY